MITAVSVLIGCNATFRKLELMRRHMRAKHPKVLYKCLETKCKFRTQVKTELNRYHYAFNVNVFKFLRSNSWVIQSIDIYFRHWNVDHSHLHSKKDLVCNICNKRFKKNWNIRVHMAGKHKIVDPKLTVSQFSISPLTVALNSFSAENLNMLYIAILFCNLLF